MGKRHEWSGRERGVRPVWTRVPLSSELAVSLLSRTSAPNNLISVYNSNAFNMPPSSGALLL